MSDTAGAVAGLANVGVGIAGLLSNNAAEARREQLARETLDFQRQNAVNQQMVQALVNQRAVAGTSDSFGSSLKYDPTTNTWVNTLGPLPKAAQTSAIQGAIAQNTTDRARIELANQVAAQRAGMAGPAADAAVRDLSSFRPMQGDELTGLLTNQATAAARQAYDPLRADVLRSTARTGTAAGPVLAELGRSEAQNLRNSLIDAQIQGMTGVGNINQQRLGNLTGRVQSTLGAASPQFNTPPIASSSTSDILSQLASQRANSSGTTTAFGSTGPNNASTALNTATTGAIGNVPNTNFGLDKIGTALGQLGQSGGQNGSLTNLLNFFSPKQPGQVVGPQQGDASIFGS